MTMGAAASLRDPAAPSRENQVGQIYSDVSDRKWVRFQPTLTANELIRKIRLFLCSSADGMQAL